VRLEGKPGLDVVALGRAHGVEPARMQEALAELRRRGLVDGSGTLTPEGCEVFSRLAAARRQRLEELFAEWPPEKRQELAAILRRLAQELVPDARPVPLRERAPA
jgi:Mn-dependent DtxR family transcriptional regulator